MRLEVDTADQSRSAVLRMRHIESLGMPEDETAFWRYIARNATRYPVDKYIPPLKRSRGKLNVRRIVGARIGTGNDASGQPVPRVLQLYDGSYHFELAVSGDSDGADAFVREALTKANRSAFFVFARGSRVELRLIAQRWGERLIALGFTVDVLMGGSKLKALVIKKARHRWYLTDWESLTGLPSTAIRSFVTRADSPSTASRLLAITVWQAATYAQNLIVSWFGVGLSLTISSTGLRAAQRTLSERVCKFKPTPMLVAMARAGAGFRGGIVSGKRYRGPAYLVDINRAYTAALRHELPWRAIFGQCVKEGVERPGMYVCRIFGRTGLRPVYVGVWNGRETEPQYTNCDSARGLLTVLPSVEFGGIRALGYDVRPAYGVVYARTFTLAPFVDRIVEVCRAYGWDSVEARLTKPMGNGIYGKFAADPERRDLRLAFGRPGAEWRVFVDEDGWPVEDLWERKVTVYQQSQHIEIAADITARVRGQIYEATAAIEANGGQVCAVSTDAIVVNIEPSNILAVHQSEFGKFKLADADDDGIVAGRNAYAIGNKTVIPDHPDPVREDIVSLFTQYVVEADTTRSGAPRPGAPLSWKVRKRITIPSEDRCTTMDRQSMPLTAGVLGPPGTAKSLDSTHISHAAD